MLVISSNPSNTHLWEWLGQVFRGELLWNEVGWMDAYMDDTLLRYTHIQLSPSIPLRFSLLFYPDN